MSTDNDKDDVTHTHEHSGSPRTRIFLVPFPKFIFMYPTLIISLVAWIALAFNDSAEMSVLMTGLFLGIMAVNTFIIVFDFPRATSLTLFFIISTIALGAWVLFSVNPNILPSIEKLVMALRPEANSAFFGCISVAMILMYIAVFISTKFNYWELSNNELMHHHGFLSDLKRYPAPNLRVDKEVNDVFEYMLLGAGRLILHPTTETRAIVLDNILFVSNKERELTKVLGSIRVKIGNDSA